MGDVEITLPPVRFTTAADTDTPTITLILRGELPDGSFEETWKVLNIPFLLEWRIRRAKKKMMRHYAIAWAKLGEV